MLTKMIVHGLIAAGLVAGGGALYTASAADQPARPADTGYVTTPAAPAVDNGYVPMAVGDKHGRRHDDHEAREKWEKREKRLASTVKSRRDHDDDD